jgi:glutamate/tyrosine decarboxylase-like PLP-dependent enzyme
MFTDGQEFLLEGTRTLMVVTVYRVVQQWQIKGSGPTTSVMQQWRKLREKGIDDLQSQQQTHNDLTEFLKPYGQARTEILVMIDANNPITSAAMGSFLD